MHRMVAFAPFGIMLCWQLLAVHGEDLTSSLPYQEGLVSWFDSSQLATLIQPEVTDTESSPNALRKIAAWRDRRHPFQEAVQSQIDSQPLLVELPRGDSMPPFRVVRFDGEDDHLCLKAFQRRFENLTLFVVAVPRANPGGYRGFVSFNGAGEKDYQSGLTVDLNANFSSAFDNLNVEGLGFGGAKNLLKNARPLGEPVLVEVVVDGKLRQLRLVVDGKLEGSREFMPAELRADQLNLGCRFYNNEQGANRVNSFLPGDLAEVVLFDHVLTDKDTQDVRTYFERKYVDLKEAYQRERKRELASQNIEPLVAVANAPPIQMLIPGFQVDELPVELTNLNNLRYRPDGKLYALGYDGNITLLSDLDGDGREDTATRFFENKGSLRGPIGMAVIPENHRLLSESLREGRVVGQGVIIASKGKVSAILDLDGDEVAETERVIASGWVEIPQNVDAVGIAIHPDDGGIYFGLGTAAYNNAYLLDAEGVSKFDLKSERGTIQRIAPDLSERTTVCTGIRFPIGMDFDDQRQLFVSDQEGATWLPNGNPFDELLHIQPGKHYGFPPRHPRHLPNVLDEPSVFDYGPQHQSTCGMTFNRPFSTGGPIFGPNSWRNDLLVTGESRGKLYRTRLIQDSTGAYLARNELIGCLTMLTVDCCISPRGDLLVACHSGGPDWGTGPRGKGRVFRIRYVDREAPQVEGVWVTGPQEVRIVFDRPLDPERLQGLVEQTSITYGEYVAAGDRFETIRPGYAVVQQQQSSPRKRLPIFSASVTGDRKSLILGTGIHPSATKYAIKLPGIGRVPRTAGITDEFAQFPEIDLAYSLQGVIGKWESSQPNVPEVHRWLPHVDSEVIGKYLPREDAQEFQAMMQRSGTLTIEGQIDPRGWIFPSVQPGSKLDYPPDQDQWISNLSVWIQCELPMAMTVAGRASFESKTTDNGLHEVRIPIPLHGSDSVPFRLHFSTGKGDGKLKIGWRAQSSDGTLHEGPVPLHRLIVPWTRLEPSESPVTSERTIKELAGGSWGRGRQVFFSEQASCGKCHVAHGHGANIGPDLSNLIHRDFASVHRDVVHPSFAINPDYVTYTGLTVDGRAVTGVIRSAGEKVQFGDKEGRVTEIARADLESLQPTSVSVMPEGIPERLGPDRMKDLLTFLLQDPPRMVGKVLQDRQPSTPKDLRQVGLPRSRAEVLALLGEPQAFAKDATSLNILLVAGTKDHGPGEHDYPAWLKVWSELLSAAPNVAVDTAMEWPTPAQFTAAQTIIFYQKGKWSIERGKDIDAYLARGGGLVYLHWAVEGGAEAEAFAERIGLASNSRQTKYRHGPLEMTFAGDRHPITRGMKTVRFYDESYWALIGNPQGDLDRRFQVLGTTVEAEHPRPLIWTLEPGRGRIFVSILGHYSWTFDDPLFRVLLLRGICWSANQPMDRLNDVVLLGASLQE